MLQSEISYDFMGIMTPHCCINSLACANSINVLSLRYNKTKNSFCENRRSHTYSIFVGKKNHNIFGWVVGGCQSLGNHYQHLQILTDFGQDGSKSTTC